jgi:glycine/serine hydroxymethyltransferase
MKEPEMREIGRLIAEIIQQPETEEVRTKVQHGVAELTAWFPLYPKRLKSRSSETSAMRAD